MTDYFALLDQPRAPWLDLEDLKEAYRRKTLETHPDTGGAERTDARFAEINKGFQILEDPKRRLQHVLELEGRPPPASGQSVPGPLHDLFPKVGALIQRAQQLSHKLGATSNALSRSLLKPEALEVQRELVATRAALRNLEKKALGELEASNVGWMSDRSAKFERIADLYYAFAYLSRWTAQLDEIEFQLSAL